MNIFGLNAVSTNHKEIYWIRAHINEYCVCRTTYSVPANIGNRIGNRH